MIFQCFAPCKGCFSVEADSLEEAAQKVVGMGIHHASINNRLPEHILSGYVAKPNSSARSGHLTKVDWESRELEKRLERGLE